MSLGIWPPISPEDLKVKREECLKRELAWLVDEVRETMKEIKHGLEDCYALLAPIDPGSTLVMSTPRNERVKGTITRVGTRIVKVALHTQLRTQPAQTINLDPAHPIHIAPLVTIKNHLDEAVELLRLTLGYPLNATFMAAQLRILAQLLSDSSTILKGPPLTESDPDWTTRSCAAGHFSPPFAKQLSFHLGLQESCIVLWLRSLEPADTPMHFGTKLGLAIGTVRRLEHDEMDMAFSYAPNTDVDEKDGGNLGKTKAQQQMTDVFVREKVRVESADPNLMSLYAKLGSLSHTLALSRQNLAAVMGEVLDD